MSNPVSPASVTASRFASRGEMFSSATPCHLSGRVTEPNAASSIVAETRLLRESQAEVNRPDIGDVTSGTTPATDVRGVVREG